MSYLRGGEEKPVLDETMKVFYRVLRWRLLRNDCTNRGYILHNYPTFRSELEFIFNKISMRKFKRKVPKKKKPAPVE
jgi:adenylate kinase